MTYFLNSLIDMCAIPAILVGLALFGWLLLRTFVWVLERRSEMLFSAQMRREEIESAALDNQRKATEIEKQRADLALVMLDPTRPALARSAVESGKHDTAMLMLAAGYIETLKPAQPVPTTLHYAPHFAKGDSKQLAQDDQPLLTVIPQMGDFMQLFNQGLLPKDKFLLGQDMAGGEMVTAGWRDFYSTLIGGASGSGKSTLVRSILAQAALQGSRFMVIDPHFGAGDESLGESLAPLQSRMLTAVASKDDQMVATLKNVTDIGRRRLLGEDTDKSPVVLIVDETTGLLQRGNVKDQLIETLGFISQETRKVGVYAIAIGQIFTASVLPSEVRNCFVNFISCRTRKDNARYMTSSNEFGEIAANLTIGQCVRMSPSGEVTRIAVPNCTQQHLEMIAGENGAFYALPRASASVAEGLESESGRTAEGAGKESGRAAEGTSNTATSQRILDLFCAGNSVYTIVKDVYGIDGGRKYQQMVENVQDVIRVHMNNLGGK